MPSGLRRFTFEELPGQLDPSGYDSEMHLFFSSRQINKLRKALDKIEIFHIGLLLQSVFPCNITAVECSLTANSYKIDGSHDLVAFTN